MGSLKEADDVITLNCCQLWTVISRGLLLSINNSASPPHFPSILQMCLALLPAATWELRFKHIWKTPRWGKLLHICLRCEYNASELFRFSTWTVWAFNLNCLGFQSELFGFSYFYGRSLQFKIKIHVTWNKEGRRDWDWILLLYNLRTWSPNERG